MAMLWDRLVLWLGCSLLLVGQPTSERVVAAELVALTVSALSGYLPKRRWVAVGIATYTGLSLLYPEFGCLLPLVYYAWLPPGRNWWVLAGGAVLLLGCSPLPFDRSLPIIGLLAISGLLHYRTAAWQASQAELRQQRDSGRELALGLEQQHQQLQEKQEYEIRLATLNERNRIAREIHDQVGHLLSRSLLQTAALLVSQPTAAGNQLLQSLHDTLAEAMDSIRASVHNLHEESVDLHNQLEALAEGFLFCPIKLDYRLECQPEKAVQYCLLSAAKEGLHNIAKHSDASQVNLTLLEHPALYQLVLQDNGSPSAAGQSGGLGLASMAERVQALGGQFRAGWTTTGQPSPGWPAAGGEPVGFRIFISIPKRG